MQDHEHLFNDRSDPYNLPADVILPEHAAWYRRFLKESREHSIEELFKKNGTSYEFYRQTARPESDPLDVFRREVQRPLDFSKREQIRFTQERLSAELEKDIQASLEEHQKLQYQFRTWALNSDDPKQNWPGIERHSEKKALAFLHASKNYAEWKVSLLRYLRYRWENQQADELQAFIEQFRQPNALQKLSTSETKLLLGGHTVSVLSSLGIPFITTDKNAVINPGKLEQLGITQQTVLASPKFYLAMPDNPFVHAGNRSYANLYQVIAVENQKSGTHDFFLLADFYYAPLSLQELKTITERFLPEKELPDNPSEQLILETTGIMPKEFTTSAPFELFLSMAHSLERDVAVPFVQTQATTQDFVQKQKWNVSKGAALFSQILLTEYALSQYFPQRQNYVGEVLSRTFDVILIAVFTGQELTEVRSQQLLKEYRQTLVLDLEKIQERDVNWDTYTVNRSKSATHADVAQKFASDNVYKEQQETAWAHRDLIEKGNLFLMALEPFIKGAATGIPSCATCVVGALGKLGGLKNLPGASGGTASAAAGVGSSGWNAGGSTGLPFSLSGYSGGSARPWTGMQSPSNTFDAFLQRNFLSAGEAWDGLRSYINPGELLTYFMNEQAVIATR